MNSKYNGVIENWVVIYDNLTLCEKDKHFHILGTLNGVPFNTSRVIVMGAGYVKTKNSTYELGIPLINLRIGLNTIQASVLLKEEN